MKAAHVFLGAGLAALGCGAFAGLEGQALGSLSVRIGPASRLALVSGLILFLSANGLGLGYAFWTGALSLAVLGRMDLEEAVNHFSSVPLSGPVLMQVWTVQMASVLAVVLARMRVVRRWRTFIAGHTRREGESCARAVLQEAGEALLPGAGGPSHGSGEPAFPSGSERYGAWIFPAMDLLLPWGPTFLVASWLLGLAVPQAAFLFVGLSLTALAAGLWERWEHAEEPPGEDPLTQEGSAELLLWAAAPFAALAAGMSGLAVGSVLILSVAWIRLRKGSVDRFAAFLSDGRPSVRQEAAQALAAAGVGRTAETLSRLLTDPDPRIREAALDGLGAMAKARHAPRLLPSLTDPEAQVRQAAVWALARSGGRSQIGRIRPLDSDPDPGVRENAQKALAALGQRRILPRRTLFSEGLSMDLAVLVVGIASYTSMVEGAGLVRETADLFSAWGMAGWKGFLLSFLAAFFGAAAAGRTLAGIAIAFPVFSALSFSPVSPTGSVSPALALAVAGGALLGAILRPFPVRDEPAWQRPKWAQSIPAVLAIVLVSLLPGFMQEWTR